MKHESKLTAEKNKEQGFKYWNKAPDCFKHHQNSKSHSFEIMVPSCNDPSAILNEQLAKSKSTEQQYLKTVMECIQYLAHRVAIKRIGSYQ